MALNMLLRRIPNASGVASASDSIVPFGVAPAVQKVRVAETAGNVDLMSKKWFALVNLT